eukprot:TRINITY_DN1182_c0_g1_i2.p2 TRINITY_DN1182_c0_g1~~TRINITY_DN1182_c0_g1_i2.p2  ORF type:complete len:293 (+),score=15.44 TRINITY_DN1182_c0_g1_i2:107-880(+)
MPSISPMNIERSCASENELLGSPEIIQQLMEHLLASSDPDLLFSAPKEGAILPEDFKELQSFEEFVNSPIRYKVTKQRRTLHVYTLGPMSSKDQKACNTLISFIRAFFSLPVVLKGNLEVNASKDPLEYFVQSDDSFEPIQAQCRRRVYRTGEKGEQKLTKEVIELNAVDILKTLYQYVESDTYTVVGITSHQMYCPSYTNDAIMGYSCRCRCCVISIPECFEPQAHDPLRAYKCSFLLTLFGKNNKDTWIRVACLR